jgi:CheY-like chemotaxis protein
MLLVVSGRVIWSDRERTALAISRHEFMPEAQYRPTDLRSILPLRMISPRAGARRAAKTESTRSVVLVVDNDDRQGILAKLLESYGYVVQYAERSRALNLLESGGGGIDILVTNDMRGFESFAARLPIVLTLPDGAPREAAADLARRVIRKPFVFREIVSAIQELSAPAERRANVVPMRIC